MDFAQELIRRQNYLLAILAEIGGEIFYDLCHLVGTQLDVLITAGERRKQFLILWLHEFLQQLSLIRVESILTRHLQVILYCDGDMQDDGVALIFTA